MNFCLPIFLAAVGGTGESVEALGVKGQMDVNGWMSVLTWGTFIVAFILLYKIAWKPILTALDRREKEIDQSLKEAEKARHQTAQAIEQQKKLIAEADARAKGIVDEARQAALTVTAALEAKSREQARGLIEEATREIEFQKNRASDALQREAADLAVQLARRVLARETGGALEAAFTERMSQELGTHEPR